MNRLLISTPSAIARAGLTALISEQTQTWTITSVTSLKDWLEAEPALSVDVALLDLSSQDSDLSLDLPETSEHLAVPMVVLVDPEAEFSIRELLQAGVQAVLPSDAAVTEILAALDAALAGLITFHPSLVEDVWSHFPSPVSALSAEPKPALTPREIEVLTLLAQGASNKTIAQTLIISEHTVKFHLSAIFAKLDVSTRTEAAIAGARLGLILL